MTHLPDSAQQRRAFVVDAPPIDNNSLDSNPASNASDSADSGGIISQHSGVVHFGSPLVDNVYGGNGQGQPGQAPDTNVDETASQGSAMAGAAPLPVTHSAQHGDGYVTPGGAGSRMHSPPVSPPAPTPPAMPPPTPPATPPTLGDLGGVPHIPSGAPSSCGELGPSMGASTTSVIVQGSSGTTATTTPGGGAAAGLVATALVERYEGLVAALQSQLQVQAQQIEQLQRGSGQSVPSQNNPGTLLPQFTPMMVQTPITPATGPEAVLERSGAMDRTCSGLHAHFADQRLSEAVPPPPAYPPPPLGVHQLQDQTYHHHHHSASEKALLQNALRQGYDAATCGVASSPSLAPLVDLQSDSHARPIHHQASAAPSKPRVPDHNVVFVDSVTSTPLLPPSQHTSSKQAPALKSTSYADESDTKANRGGGRKDEEADMDVREFFPLTMARLRNSQPQQLDNEGKQKQQPSSQPHQKAKPVLSQEDNQDWIQAGNEPDVQCALSKAHHHHCPSCGFEFRCDSAAPKRAECQNAQNVNVITTREEIEALVRESLAQYAEQLDQSLAKALAARLRRVTEAHVESTVNREVQRTLHSAFYDEAHDSHDGLRCLVDRLRAQRDADSRKTIFDEQRKRYLRGKEIPPNNESNLTHNTSTTTEELLRRKQPPSAAEVFRKLRVPEDELNRREASPPQPTLEGQKVSATYRSVPSASTHHSWQRESDTAADLHGARIEAVAQRIAAASAKLTELEVSFGSSDQGEKKELSSRKLAVHHRHVSPPRQNQYYHKQSDISSKHPQQSTGLRHHQPDEDVVQRYLPKRR